MLREHGRQLTRAWLVTFVALAASAYGVLVLAPELQRGVPILSVRFTLLVALGVCVTLSWMAVLTRFGIYDSQRRSSIAGQIGRSFVANGLASLVLSGIVIVAGLPVSPLLPLLMGVVLFVAHTSLNLPTFLVLHALRRSGRNFRNILLIGAGPRAHRAMEVIEDHPEWGYRIIGFVDDGSSEFVPAVPPERIHKYIDVPRVLRDEIVDEVVVACPRSMLGSLAPIVSECMMIGVPVTMLTDLFGEQLPPPKVGRFGDLSTLTFAPVHHNEFELALKRMVDVGAATVGLVVAAPVVIGAALAIKATSQGPVFFRQTRAGRNARPFEMVKLRTMVEEAETRKAELLHLNELDGPVFKMRDDPRVTPIGRVLRKWSIDELPQLWNVLRGDMSIVGPRPPTFDEVAQYRGRERRRLSMRPGLTCIWQISGRNEIGFDEWMKLDLQYIDDWSLGADLRIMLLTIPEVLRARGAS